MTNKTGTASTLWVDEEHKIASFHEMKDFKKLDFEEHEFFQMFVDGLVANWYRFL
jgi:hypothetical protein